MPELPEVDAYVAGVEAHVAGQRLEAVRLASPFLLRTVEPPLEAAVGRTLIGAHRIGKRIALDLEGDLHLVVHPMIAGRLRWKPRGAKLPGRGGLLALDLERGALTLTEAGTKRRAWLRVVSGTGELRDLDPGGLEVLRAAPEVFAARLTDGGHTLKRALTTPRLFSGIGNAWSDEILFRGRLSPMRRASSLEGDEVRRLHAAAVEVLTEARDRLVARARERFPDKVTAFQPEMLVHGRFGEPCAVCGSPVQRVTRAGGHDFHYCAECQNGGRILADRSLSRLLKDDFPKRIEDLLE